MLKYNIVKPLMTKVLTISESKRLLKVMATSIAKQVKADQKKSNFLKFVPLLGNKSDFDILILIPAQQQKLAQGKFI